MHLQDLYKTYDPPLYNVWKQQKKGGDTGASQSTPFTT